jgi:hypothetical protein
VHAPDISCKKRASIVQGAAKVIGFSQ